MFFFLSTNSGNCMLAFSFLEMSVVEVYIKIQLARSVSVVIKFDPQISQ